MAQVIVVVPIWAIILVQSFNGDGCFGRQTCDYTLATATQFMAPIAAVCALAATIPLTVLAGKRGRPLVVPAICGLALVLVVGTLAIILNIRALA